MPTIYIKRLLWTNSVDIMCIHMCIALFLSRSAFFWRKCAGKNISAVVLFVVVFTTFMPLHNVSAQAGGDVPTGYTPVGSSEKSDDTVKQGDSGTETKAEGCTDDVLKKARQDNDISTQSYCAGKQATVTWTDLDGKEYICGRTPGVLDLCTKDNLLDANIATFDGKTFISENGLSRVAKENELATELQNYDELYKAFDNPEANRSQLPGNQTQQGEKILDKITNTSQQSDTGTGVQDPNRTGPEDPGFNPDVLTPEENKLVQRLRALRGFGSNVSDLFNSPMGGGPFDFGSSPFSSPVPNSFQSFSPSQTFTPSDTGFNPNAISQSSPAFDSGFGGNVPSSLTGGALPPSAVDTFFQSPSGSFSSLAPPDVVPKYQSINFQGSVGIGVNPDGSLGFFDSSGKLVPTSQLSPSFVDGFLQTSQTSIFERFGPVGPLGSDFVAELEGIAGSVGSSGFEGSPEVGVNNALKQSIGSSLPQASLGDLDRLDINQLSRINDALINLGPVEANRILGEELLNSSIQNRDESGFTKAVQAMTDFGKAAYEAGVKGVKKLGEAFGLIEPDPTEGNITPKDIRFDDSGDADAEESARAADLVARGQATPDDVTINAGEGIAGTPDDRFIPTDPGLTPQQIAGQQAQEAERKLTVARENSIGQEETSGDPFTEDDNQPLETALIFSKMRRDNLIARKNDTEVLQNIKNSSIGNAERTKALQRQLGFTGEDVDGILGPKTEGALKDNFNSMIDSYISDEDAFAAKIAGMKEGLERVNVNTLNYLDNVSGVLPDNEAFGDDENQLVDYSRPERDIETLSRVTKTYEEVSLTRDYWNRALEAVDEVPEEVPSDEYFSQVQSRLDTLTSHIERFENAAYTFGPEIDQLTLKKQALEGRIGENLQIGDSLFGVVVNAPDLQQLSNDRKEVATIDSQIELHSAAQTYIDENGLSAPDLFATLTRPTEVLAPREIVERQILEQRLLGYYDALDKGNIRQGDLPIVDINESRAFSFSEGGVDFQTEIRGVEIERSRAVYEGLADVNSIISGEHTDRVAELVRRLHEPTYFERNIIDGGLAKFNDFAFSVFSKPEDVTDVLLIAPKTFSMVLAAPLDAIMNLTGYAPADRVLTEARWSDFDVQSMKVFEATILPLDLYGVGEVGALSRSGLKVLGRSLVNEIAPSSKIGTSFKDLPSVRPDLLSEGVGNPIARLSNPVSGIPVSRTDIIGTPESFVRTPNPSVIPANDNVINTPTAPARVAQPNQGIAFVPEAPGIRIAAEPTPVPSIPPDSGRGVFTNAPPASLASRFDNAFNSIELPKVSISNDGRNPIISLNDAEALGQAIYRSSPELQRVSNSLVRNAETPLVVNEIEGLVDEITSYMKQRGVDVQFVDEIPSNVLDPSGRPFQFEIDNPGRFHEPSNTLYFQNAIKNEPEELLLEMQHELGAVRLSEKFGKENIPWVDLDGSGDASRIAATHQLDRIGRRGDITDVTSLDDFIGSDGLRNSEREVLADLGAGRTSQLEQELADGVAQNINEPGFIESIASVFNPRRGLGEPTPLPAGEPGFVGRAWNNITGNSPEARADAIARSVDAREAVSGGRYLDGAGEAEVIFDNIYRQTDSFAKIDDLLEGANLRSRDITQPEVDDVLGSVRQRLLDEHSVTIQRVANDDARNLGLDGWTDDPSVRQTQKNAVWNGNQRLYVREGLFNNTEELLTEIRRELGRVEVAKVFGGADNIPAVRINGENVSLDERLTAFQLVESLSARSPTMLQRIRQTPLKSTIDAFVFTSQLLNPIADIAKNFRVADNLASPAIERAAGDLLTADKRLKGYLPGQSATVDTARAVPVSTPATQPPASVTSPSGTQVTPSKFEVREVVYHKLPTSVTNELESPGIPGVAVNTSRIIRPSAKTPFYRIANPKYEKPAELYKGIVLHHTATPTLQSALNAASSRDPSRGHGDTNFGYTYLVDLDGTIYQAAPFNVRTNHIQGSTNRVSGSEAQNHNYVGVSCVGNSCSARQLEAIKEFSVGLAKIRPGIVEGDTINIVGHGDVNYDHGNEGKADAVAVREYVRSNLDSIKSYHQDVSPQLLAGNTFNINGMRVDATSGINPDLPVNVVFFGDGFRAASSNRYDNFVKQIAKEKTNTVYVHLQVDETSNLQGRSAIFAQKGGAETLKEEVAQHLSNTYKNAKIVDSINNGKTIFIGHSGAYKIIEPALINGFNPDVLICADCMYAGRAQFEKYINRGGTFVSLYTSQTDGQNSSLLKNISGIGDKLKTSQSPNSFNPNDVVVAKCGVGHEECLLKAGAYVDAAITNPSFATAVAAPVSPVASATPKPANLVKLARASDVGSPPTNSREFFNAISEEPIRTAFAESLGRLGDSVGEVGDALNIVRTASAGYCSGCLDPSEFSQIARRAISIFEENGFSSADFSNVLDNARAHVAIQDATRQALAERGHLHPILQNKQIAIATSWGKAVSESTAPYLTKIKDDGKSASGFYQVKPATARDLGVPDAVSHEGYNVIAGTFALNENLYIATRQSPGAASQQVLLSGLSKYLHGQNSGVLRSSYASKIAVQAKIFDTLIDKSIRGEDISDAEIGNISRDQIGDSKPAVEQWRTYISAAAENIRGGDVITKVAVTNDVSASGIRPIRVDVSIYSAESQNIVGALRRAANPIEGHKDVTPTFVALRKDGSIVSADEVITGANLKEYDVAIPEFELAGDKFVAKVGTPIPAEVFFSPRGTLSSSAKIVERLPVLRVSSDGSTAVVEDKLGKARYVIGDHARIEGGGDSRVLVIYEDPNTLKGIAHANWRAYNDNVGAVLLAQQSVPGVSKGATAAKLSETSEFDKNLSSRSSEWYRITNPDRNVFDVRFDYYKSGDIAQANRFRLAGIKDGTFPAGTQLRYGEHTRLTTDGTAETATGPYFVTPDGGNLSFVSIGRRGFPTAEETVALASKIIEEVGGARILNDVWTYDAAGNLYDQNGKLIPDFKMNPVGFGASRVAEGFNKIAATTALLNEAMRRISGETIVFTSGHRPGSVGSSRHTSDKFGNSGLPGHERDGFTYALDYRARSASEADRYALVVLGNRARFALNEAIEAQTGQKNFIKLSVGATYTGDTPAMVHLDTDRRITGASLAYHVNSNPSGTLLGDAYRTYIRGGYIPHEALESLFSRYGWEANLSRDVLVDAATGKEIKVSKSLSDFSDKSDSPFFVAYNTKAVVSGDGSIPPIAPGNELPTDTIGLRLAPRRVGDLGEFDEFFENVPEGLRAQIDDTGPLGRRYFVNSEDDSLIALESLPDAPTGYRWVNRANESIDNIPNGQLKDVGWVAMPYEEIPAVEGLRQLRNIIIGSTPIAGLGVGIFGSGETDEERKVRESVSYERDGSAVYEGETKPLKESDTLGVPEAVPDTADPTKLTTKVPAGIPKPPDVVQPPPGPGRQPQTRPTDPLKDLVDKLLGGLGGAGGGSGGGATPQQTAQNTQPPAPPEASTTPRLACANDVAIINGHGTTTVRWACANGSTSRGIGFETNGSASGQITFTINDTSSQNTIQSGIECIRNGAVTTRTCEIPVVHPSVNVIANPSRVESGDRAQIIWSSVGTIRSTSACLVFSSEGAITRGGQTGTVETLALTRNTEFGVACQTSSGTSVINKIVVRVSGDGGDPAPAVLNSNSSDPEVASFIEDTQEATSPQFDEVQTASLNEPPSETFLGTDAEGNQVQLCNPEIGITRFTWCLLKNR